MLSIFIIIILFWAKYLKIHVKGVQTAQIEGVWVL
jgi:hypothetical protein